jgi:hypothetical protein
MKWLIDGTYNDLYRTAMNDPALPRVRIEAGLYDSRNLSRGRNLLLACGGHLSFTFALLCGALPENQHSEEQNHGFI